MYNAVLTQVCSADRGAAGIEADGLQSAAPGNDRQDGIGLFTHESEVWNRCLGRACRALSELTTKATAILPSGVMWFWARDWLMFDRSDGEFDGRLLLVDVRPRVSHHGGATQLRGLAFVCPAERRRTHRVDLGRT